jgi:choline dehydrogenase-like flavoprotein
VIQLDDPSWRCEPLPLALDPAILDDSAEAARFDGSPSSNGYKGDAERMLLDRLAGQTNFRLETGREIVSLLHRDGDPSRIEGAVCADGRRYVARYVVLAAGAMTSPRLLQRHLRATGLERCLPGAAMIGAGIQLHLNTALLAFGARPCGSTLCKTASFFHDCFPHSTVQCLGRIDGRRLASRVPGVVPRWVCAAAATRALGFFVMTEDGSSPANRVISRDDGTPMLDYDPARLGTAVAEHRAAIAAFKRRLLRAGFLTVVRAAGSQGTAHAVGTMAAGTDPRRSVVDPRGAVHGMEGLFVADGSVLPRIGRVNPALTIYAWGLRLGTLLPTPGACASAPCY